MVLNAGAQILLARWVDLVTPLFSRTNFFNFVLLVQLGIGDTKSYGVDITDMGDNLPFVNLTSTPLLLRASQLACGSVFCCVILATFDATTAGNGRIKCWGDNNVGQLGLGDQEVRGDSPNELGDALPFVDLGNAADGSSWQALALSAGADMACAILGSQGGLKCVFCFVYNSCVAPSYCFFTFLQFSFGEYKLLQVLGRQRIRHAWASGG
jgi:hypothetical protein